MMKRIAAALAALLAAFALMPACSLAEDSN